MPEKKETQPEPDWADRLRESLRASRVAGLEALPAELEAARNILPHVYALAMAGAYGPRADGRRLSVSLEQKINTGNYESASVHLSLSQIPVGATEADIFEMLETQKIAYDVLREELLERAKGVRDAAQREVREGPY